MAVSPINSSYPTWQKAVEAIARALNRAIKGEIAIVGEDVTLTASAASTTVTDQKVGLDRAIYLQPTTANAAAALGTTYIDPAEIGDGTYVIRHANNAQTDRTFRPIIVG